MTMNINIVNSGNNVKRYKVLKFKLPHHATKNKFFIIIGDNLCPKSKRIVKIVRLLSILYSCGVVLEPLSTLLAWVSIWIKVI